jgi:CIC family chloride channel protein
VFYKSWQTWWQSRHFGRSAIDSRYALAEASLIGILSAFAALLLKEGVVVLGTWRVHMSYEYGAWWILPLFGGIFGYLAGVLVQEFAPDASGGGIPQVKAALARYPLSLTWRVALIKLIGSILILGGGLTLGRRAPTVHIGAAIAAQLSSWLPTSPEHRRQMIAAGAAAGLAAGFTTPIAGVMFVVEELMRDVSGLTLETAIVASFIGAVVSLTLQSPDFRIPSIVGGASQNSFSHTDIPFYVVLGALAGVLGVVFNRGILISLGWQKRLNLPLSWRICAIGSISGAIIATLPPFFRDNAGLKDTLLSGELNEWNVVIAFVAHFFLTMVAYSSGTPGGLFAPALVMGSALGYLMGEVAQYVTGIDSGVTYALAGMGAFFTAVVRVPITATVIVFELNTDFNLVLPLMLTCAVSYIVAESLFKGSLYQHLLHANGINLSEEGGGNSLLLSLTALDVMQTKVESLSAHFTLEETLHLMSRSHHRGFPVLQEGRLVGIFTQSDLDKWKLQGGNRLLKEVMTTNPMTVTPTTPLGDVLFLLNRYQLSRLPVIEGQKLVGIITRTDIIRIEANQLSCDLPNPHTGEPSYLVYQTRAPNRSQGRILLPLANPDTAEALWHIARGIAIANNYEIECLQVLPIPKHSQPSQIATDTRQSRRLMQRLERLGRKSKIPVSTQIRQAHNIASAILETIQERHISLLLMGWQGNSTGDTVDTLIHQAPCDLMLVRLGSESYSYPFALTTHATWLIPNAGGPNSQKALELLPGLLGIYSHPQGVQIRLCQIYSPRDAHPDYARLQETALFLKDKLASVIIPVPVRSPSLLNALIHLAQGEEYQGIVLGVSREGLLQQVIHGNIPEAIARNTTTTIILVRSALG